MKAEIYLKGILSLKKILLLIAAIILVLFVVDSTLLKDNNALEKVNENETYEKIAEAESLPVGLDNEERAPSFTVQTLTGETTTIEDYLGKKILLNFWATWCPPCKEEMPYMNEFYMEYEGEDYVVLAVNVTSTEKSKEDVTKFVEEHSLNFPILMDEMGEIAHQYEILSYPTSFFIDTEGVIRNRIVGTLSKDMIYREMLLLP